MVISRSPLSCVAVGLVAGAWAPSVATHPSAARRHSPVIVRVIPLPPSWLSRNFVADVLDGFADLASTFADRFFDLARRAISRAFVAKTLVVAHLAGFFFQRSLDLVGLSADLVLILHHGSSGSTGGRVQDSCLTARALWSRSRRSGCRR